MDERIVKYDIRALQQPCAIERFVRQQLWIDPAGPKEARLQAAFDELVIADGDGWSIGSLPAIDIGVVTWAPR